MEEIYLHKLSLRDIKPTAMRLLILRTMMEMKRAVSVTWRINSTLLINLLSSGH